MIIRNEPVADVLVLGGDILVGDKVLLSDSILGKLDYAKIQPIDNIKRHYETKQFVMSVAKAFPYYRIVVVTHHSPSYERCPDEHKKDSILNGGFHSGLTEIMEKTPHIHLWIHGHSHWFCDYRVGPELGHRYLDIVP